VEQNGMAPLKEPRIEQLPYQLDAGVLTLGPTSCVR
jgi:hypothetical protein